ncbi:hypothetical protein [Bartonella sp. TP]|uniref:hypothetical protein n=1 Tax=Bartonella sp. TP TaxID=3057550 RepID=UPI0025B03EDB|nr:hypothetical protein [Bartonella sp. TP]MDN5248879.1 hypothetical protein [Alphaproteobacteria bacterium]WJW79597.1 hypothetical protein QVL57_03490 [Bartonella sp. TP]
MQDPTIENIRKRLTRLMLVSIIITLTLLASVVITLIYKLNHLDNHYISQQTIELPAGAKIISQSLNQQTIALHLKLRQNKEAILLYDYKKARILSELLVHMTP